MEILGWLYQFYISDKKDGHGHKSAVPTEDIPAVTQLFTPHWIVRYLVENSLGRLWLLNRPGSRLRERMPYYIEEEPETDFLKIAKPEDIRLLDPAVGSGHMLTYALICSSSSTRRKATRTRSPGSSCGTTSMDWISCRPACGAGPGVQAQEEVRRFFQAGQLVQPNIIERDR